MDCLVDFIEEISTSLDQGSYVVTIFFALSKEFDTVNHSILLSKFISYCSIQNSHMNWFKSYLSKRKKRAFVNGSILGSLLFLIYINDFPHSSNFFAMRLFTDDTFLAVSDISIGELLQQINLELPSIYNWLCATKLTLNLKKKKQVHCPSTSKES